MDKKTYLAQFSSYLKDLSKEEFDDAMHYVEEYFDEAGVENEQSVIEELGPPAKYAAQIKATATIKENRKNVTDSVSTKSGIKSIWYIIGGICALPIALPLLIVALALVLTFICLIFAFSLATFAISIAGIIVSISLFISAIPLFSISFVNGLMAVGISISLLGGSIFGITILIMIVSKFFPWLIHVLSNLFYKLKGGNKNESRKTVN